MDKKSPHIGYFDNRELPLLEAGQIAPSKTALLSRVTDRARGRRRLLYRDGGLHLRLPSGNERFVYVYIRKNGCSAFKNWMLKAVGGPRGPETNIGELKRHFAVSMEWELQGAKTILVLRDPIKRTCSLFRNKFIQQKNADDIKENFERLTGMNPEEASFRDFVFAYLERHLQKEPPDWTDRIDVHCKMQIHHLWPIIYDNVLMLDDLPAAAEELFGTAVAQEFFLKRQNSSSDRLMDENATDVSASDLHAAYRKTGALPTDASLLDSRTRSAIESLYAQDFRLLETAMRQTHQPVSAYVGGGK